MEENLNWAVMYSSDLHQAALDGVSEIQKEAGLGEPLVRPLGHRAIEEAISRQPGLILLMATMVNEVQRRDILGLISHIHREIARKHLATKVFMVTSGDEEVIEMLKAKGVEEVIPKPEGFEGIGVRIKGIVDKGKE